jgi:hypothetical protein
MAIIDRKVRKVNVTITTAEKQRGNLNRDIT